MEGLCTITQTGSPLHNHTNRPKHPCVWTHMDSYIMSSLMPLLSCRALCDAFCGLRVLHRWYLKLFGHFDVLTTLINVANVTDVRSQALTKTTCFIETHRQNNSAVTQNVAPICLHAGSFRHSARHGQCCCIKAEGPEFGQHRAGAVPAQSPGSSG